MRKTLALSAVTIGLTIACHVSASRAFAQSPNVVIQWNQTLQTLFVGTGPGVHIRALPMMHIASNIAMATDGGKAVPFRKVPTASPSVHS